MQRSKIPDTPGDLLQVEGLTVDFGTGGPTVHRALNQVSLSVGKGEALGIVGESGAGKTVLTHTILGLLPASGRISSGCVRWRGREIQGLSEAQLHPIRGREIALVFQDPQASLNPVYPVGAQIQWVLKRHCGLTGAKAKTRAIELFESVKLRDPERCFAAYAHELSGGMCQRVMIAMALAGEPELLIADEPTSALDVSVAAGIVELLSSLREQRALSILLITHDLAVAARVCDRIAVIDEGKIVETKPAQNFISHAKHPASRKLIDSNLYLGGKLAA